MLYLKGLTVAPSAGQGEGLGMAGAMTILLGVYGGKGGLISKGRHHEKDEGG